MGASMARPYAEVIGDPIAHSKSPLIHNFWLQKLGIDAEYRACHVRADELADYFTRRRGDAEWRGCNVTMPHKREALNLSDEFDSVASDNLEAANTITRTDQGLKAWNTDVFGVICGLEPHVPQVDGERPFSPKTSRVQIIGAGGASQAAIAAAYRLDLNNIELFNRSVESARKVAAKSMVSRKDVFALTELGPWPGGRENHIYGKRDCRYVIINASALGMAGNPSVPIDLDEYPADTIVFEMVYHPRETSLLHEARRRSFTTIDGLEMLIGQASLAFLMFFGQPAPNHADAELRALLTA